MIPGMLDGKPGILALNGAPIMMGVPPHGAAGNFDERIFCGLDFVVAEAARRRLLLIPGLLDYWDSFGGVDYVPKAL